MTDQLALDLGEPEGPARLYQCCGLPCPTLGERCTAETPFPHADDCPNPNLDVWIHRATGMPIRRLHCGDDYVAGKKQCPYEGGRRPVPEGVYDPYNGACCRDLAAT